MKNFGFLLFYREKFKTDVFDGIIQDLIRLLKRERVKFSVNFSWEIFIEKLLSSFDVQGNFLR